MSASAAFFICVTIALFAQSLSSSYFGLPQKELRRHGREPLFKRLNMVAKYGLTSRLLLGSISFLFAASAAIVAARSINPPWSLILLALLLGLIKIAANRQFSYSDKLAAALAPYLSKLIYYINPIVELIGDILPTRKHRPQTKIYETEDLQDFIHKQQRARNNRIPHPELIAALNALEFGGKRIKDYMVRADDIHFVSIKDAVGPVLLSELHKTGFNCFPVRDESENTVAGMLYLPELTRQTEGGSVEEFMEGKVVYVRQDKALEEVLQAFSKTGRHDFMVVDETAKITGMINLKKVLEEMLGHSVRTEFEDYNNPSAVASE